MRSGLERTTRRARLGYALCVTIVCLAFAETSPDVASALVGGSARHQGHGLASELASTPTPRGWMTLEPPDTPKPTPTRTNTPTASPTRTATATPSPTSTRTPTATVVPAYTIWGRVIEEKSREGLLGAVVRLYRGTGQGWLLTRESTTDSTGRFGWTISPIIAQYRLEEQDPVGYVSVSASLAPNVSGEVLDANTMNFRLLGQPGVYGPFVFVNTQPTLTTTSTPTPTATDMATVTPTVTSTPTPTATDMATVTPTVTSAPTPTATDMATVTPTVTSTPTPTATDMATVTPTVTPSTPTPTETPGPTSTATPSPVTICLCSERGDLIYRIPLSKFRGYTTQAAKDSPLILITSPPAPQGWNQVGHIPDDSWQRAAIVWTPFWSTGHQWQPMIPDADIIGLLDSRGEAESVPGITHLIRRELEFVSPGEGMRVIHADLEMWSDNKTAWWWEGELISTDHEGYGGFVDLFPVRMSVLGGTYLLAIQNSNDTWETTNPQGTAFRVCVIWAYAPGIGSPFYMPLIMKHSRHRG